MSSASGCHWDPRMDSTFVAFGPSVLKCLHKLSLPTPQLPQAKTESAQWGAMRCASLFCLAALPTHSDGASRYATHRSQKPNGPPHHLGVQKASLKGWWSTAGGWALHCHAPSFHLRSDIWHMWGSHDECSNAPTPTKKAWQNPFQTISTRFNKDPTIS